MKFSTHLGPLYNCELLVIFFGRFCWTGDLQTSRRKFFLHGGAKNHQTAVRCRGLNRSQSGIHGSCDLWVIRRCSLGMQTKHSSAMQKQQPFEASRFCAGSFFQIFFYTKMRETSGRLMSATFFAKASFDSVWGCDYHSGKLT